MPYMHIDHSVESAYQIINLNDPMHAVGEVYLPFVTTATLRLNLIRMDSISCPSEKLSGVWSEAGRQIKRN